MENEKDPLLDTLGKDPYAVRSDRLHYATGEMLGKDDFQSEQLYHRRQLAMALRFLYGYGTLAGLKVVVEPEIDPDDSTKMTDVLVIVKPGLAIDRVGRLIEVPVPVSIRLKKWFKYITDPEVTGDPQAANLLSTFFDDDETKRCYYADIFLSFHACERGWTPAFASGPFDALDASQPNRIRDAYEVRMVLREAKELKCHDPWSDLLPVNANKGQVQNAILNSWDALEPPPSGDEQEDFHEIPAVLKDPTAIRLARLTVPVPSAFAGTPAKVDDLDWRKTTWQPDASGDNKNVDNTARNFIVPPAILRRLKDL
jgi:hypothetical protein